MELDEILELERENNEQILEAKIQQARNDNRQACINTCVFILSEQMKQSARLLLGGAFKP